MRIRPQAASLALGQLRAADHLELVILAGRLDRQVAGLRPDGERERAVGSRPGPSAASGAGRSLGIRTETHHGVRDGLAGALLGDLAANQDAAGKRQVDGLLGRPLGPCAVLAGVEVGLPVGSGGPDIESIARHGAEPEPAFGVGLGHAMAR